MRIPRRCRASLLAIATSAPFCAVAQAEIIALNVISTADVGSFRNRPYMQIEARMEGRAPGGVYDVPITLLLPKRSDDGNGVAVVDVLNTVAVGKDTVLGPDPLPLARRHIGDDFLFGTGHAYVGVLWDAEAVDILHLGSIARWTDGYTVLSDAARLARTPGNYLADPATRSRAPLKVVAFGFSQTGAFLRDFSMNHHNSAGGDLVFDGAIVGGAGGGCFGLDKMAFTGCEGPLADGGKVIAVLAEGDAQFAGGWERGENPGYRFVELAGVAHIPATVDDFRARGLSDQNPIDLGPVMRAALVNLEAWLDGVEPPPSLSLKLAVGPSTTLNGIEVTPLFTDGDGNAEGGLRLPHMPTVLGDGQPAGAPLGRYAGLALDHGENFFLALGGTFAPFTGEKLRALYPDHAAYVRRVRAAAGDLVAKRYILPEDGAAYVEAAERSSVPSAP